MLDFSKTTILHHFFSSSISLLFPFPQPGKFSSYSHTPDTYEWTVPALLLVLGPFALLSIFLFPSCSVLGEGWGLIPWSAFLRLPGLWLSLANGRCGRETGEHRRQRDQDVPSQSLPWVALWPGSVSSMASAPARSWAQVTPPSSMAPLAPREKYFLTVAHLWVSSLSPSWLHFSGTSVLRLLLSPVSSSIRVQTFFSVLYSWVKSLLWLCILSSHCPVLCSSSQ